MLYRKVDENGLFVEDIILSEPPVLTEIIIEEIEHISYSETGEEIITVETVERTVAITDENGNSIADPQYVSEPVSQGFYHPKWNGSEWVEGATQEEIDELTKPQPQEPTIEERLEQTEELLRTVTMAFTEYVFMQDTSDDS